MKRHIILLSRVFPATHPRAREPTLFAEHLGKTKIHTIRENYDFWERRIKEVERGEAVLVVREWEGKPYRSKQRTIAILTADNGVGIQRCILRHETVGGVMIDKPPFWMEEATSEVSENDGLSLNDFKDWFKGKDTVPMAIIHFTDFRY